MSSSPVKSSIGQNQPAVIQEQEPVFNPEEVKDFFHQVKECLLEDREEARQAFFEAKEVVRNSTAVDISHETQASIPQLLNTLATYDDKLVKVFDIMCDFVRPKKTAIRGNAIASQGKTTINIMDGAKRRDLLNQMNEVAKEEQAAQEAVQVEAEETLNED